MGIQERESLVSSPTFLRTLWLEVNITDPNRNYVLLRSMGLYFSRLILQDRYFVAANKLGQKQLENAGQSSVKVKIKSKITPDRSVSRSSPGQETSLDQGEIRDRDRGKVSTSDQY